MPTLQLGDASLNYREAGTGNDACAAAARLSAAFRDVGSAARRLRLALPGHRARLPRPRAQPARAGRHHHGARGQRRAHAAAPCTSASSAWPWRAPRMGGYVALELVPARTPDLRGPGPVRHQGRRPTRRSRRMRARPLRRMRSPRASLCGGRLHAEAPAPRRPTPVAAATVRHLIAEGTPEGGCRRPARHGQPPRFGADPGAHHLPHRRRDRRAGSDRRRSGRCSASHRQGEGRPAPAHSGGAGHLAQSRGVDGPFKRTPRSGRSSPRCSGAGAAALDKSAVGIIRRALVRPSHIAGGSERWIGGR